MQSTTQSDAVDRSLSTVPMSAQIKPSRKPPSQVLPPSGIKMEIEAHARGNLRGTPKQNTRYYVVWSSQSGDRNSADALGWIRVYTNEMGQIILSSVTAAGQYGLKEGQQVSSEFLHRRCSRYRPVAWQ